MTAAPSPFVRRAAYSLIEALRHGPMTKDAIAEDIGVSRETVQRAAIWLRKVCGAPLIHERCDAGTGDYRVTAWTVDPDWQIPTHELPRSAIRTRVDSGRWMPAAGENRWTKTDRGIEWVLVVYRLGLLADAWVGTTGHLQTLVFQGPRYWDNGAGKIDDPTLRAWADWQIIAHRDAAIAQIGRVLRRRERQERTVQRE